MNWNDAIRRMDYTMRLLKVLMFFGCAAGAPSAESQISVSRFRSVAGVNAYSPLDQSAYYSSMALENTSPAFVTASGDWVGTNYGGTVDTWHWVGSAQSTSRTTLVSPTRLETAGNGSFNIEMTTTAGFWSPDHQAVYYAPGAGTVYWSTFVLESAGTCQLSADLNRFSRVQLYSSSDAKFLYDRSNFSSNSLAVNYSGLLPAGEFSVQISASRAGAASVGATHEVYSGSFSNFLFTVQVPEPAGGLAIALAGGMLLRRRRVLERTVSQAY